MFPYLLFSVCEVVLPKFKINATATGFQILSSKCSKCHCRLAADPAVRAYSALSDLWLYLRGHTSKRKRRQEKRRKMKKRWKRRRKDSEGENGRGKEVEFLHLFNPTLSTVAMQCRAVAMRACRKVVRWSLPPMAILCERSWNISTTSRRKTSSNSIFRPVRHDVALAMSINRSVVVGGSRGSCPLTSPSLNFLLVRKYFKNTNFGVRDFSFCANVGTQLKCWAAMIFYVENLQLSVRKLELFAPPTFISPRRRCQLIRLLMVPFFVFLTVGPMIKFYLFIYFLDKTSFCVSKSFFQHFYF